MTREIERETPSPPPPERSLKRIRYKKRKGKKMEKMDEMRKEIKFRIKVREAKQEQEKVKIVKNKKLILIYCILFSIEIPERNILRNLHLLTYLKEIPDLTVAYNITA